MPSLRLGKGTLSNAKHAVNPKHHLVRVCLCLCTRKSSVYGIPQRKKTLLYIEWSSLTVNHVSINQPNARHTNLECERELSKH